MMAQLLISLGTSRADFQGFFYLLVGSSLIRVSLGLMTNWARWSCEFPMVAGVTVKGDVLGVGCQQQGRGGV